MDVSSSFFLRRMVWKGTVLRSRSRDIGERVWRIGKRSALYLVGTGVRFGFSNCNVTLTQVTSLVPDFSLYLYGILSKMHLCMKMKHLRTGVKTPLKEETAFV